MANWYCGAFFMKVINGVSYVLGVTVKRFPGSVKPIGGCGELPENYIMTLIREFFEETDKILSPTKYYQVHQEKIGDHVRNFFLVTEISGSIMPGEGIEVTEKDEDLLTVKLWKIEEFNKKLFFKARPAFIKACEKMRELNPEFTFKP